MPFPTQPTQQGHCPTALYFPVPDFRGEPRLRGYAANRWRVGLNPLRSRYPSLHAQTERTKSPSTAPPMLRAASLGTTGNDPPWPHRVRVLRKELKRSAISETAGLSRAIEAPTLSNGLDAVPWGLTKDQATFAKFEAPTQAILWASRPRVPSDRTNSVSSKVRVIY